MSTQGNRDSRFLLGLDANQRAELGDLAWLEAELDQYNTPPAPDAGLLVDRLSTLVAARAPEKAAPKSAMTLWWTLIRAQLLLLEPPFWIVSGVIFLIGLLLAVIGADSIVTISVAYIAPLAAALGVAYAFRPATRGLWELEQISPTRPVQLLYARLVLVLACTSLFALALLSIVWVGTPGLALWRLILAWFGPMLALASLALYLSLRFGAAMGAAFPALLWVGLVTVGWQRLPTPALSPLILVSESNVVLIGSLLMTCLALFVFSWAARLVSKERKGGAWI